MRFRLLASTFLLLLALTTFGQSNDKEPIFVIRGFSISAPKPADVDQFIRFIHEDLAPRKVNTLLLRVDYNYQYTSHPELRDSIALSSADVNALVTACRQHQIRIIPQINLLGHQSWHSKLSKLLEVYPQFDETPQVILPAEYKWPNADGLYCKSYCPLHPDVHAIVFDLMDEICDAFQTDAFHAGMDEVFYIGDDKCPRCSGRDKAELFGGEVRTLSDHLRIKNRELWIWGDRLLDGKATGMGMWEASMNQTARAIDMIPKDVVICDWHYERPDQSAVYFAMKGLRVITCPWNKPDVAIAQAEDMARWRKYATKTMKPQYYGMMQTIWTGAAPFVNRLHAVPSSNPATGGEKGNSPDTFKALFKKMDELEAGNQ